ncbi:MAG TPA: hypothetical protein VHN14_03225 [Kofleriaceae bacterium]|jgi:hypothetical protein|nr:hypothetical protein [Kofleriaceae bacterium]
MPGLEYLRYWKEGGRWDLWVHDVSMVRDFIKRHKLETIGKEELLARKRVLDAPMMPVPVATEVHPGPVPRIGYAGGMRVPHLHYDGEIYSLDRAQWREFAERTLDTLRERLGEVKSVGFEQLMELSETVSSVT